MEDIWLNRKDESMCKVFYVGFPGGFQTQGWFVLCALFALSCGPKQKTVMPLQGSITESVYASGIVKSEGQYQAYAAIAGIIDSIYVKEGQQVRKGQTLLTITSEQQKLASERALLDAEFASFSANIGQVRQMERSVELAIGTLQNDSLLLARQKRLWQQKIGTLVQLEQRQLQYNASVAALQAWQRQLTDLRRELALNARQSQLAWAAARAQQKQYRIVSEVDGVVFDLLREKGESVGSQTVLAVLGSAQKYNLELQVDEYDINRIHVGSPVFVTTDGYAGQVFDGTVTEIHPIMNSQTRTFTVEAMLKYGPALYPNQTLEANIVCAFKKSALLIPRRCMIDDSTVMGKTGKYIRVKAGIRDLEKVEILSGLSAAEEIVQPEE